MNRGNGVLLQIVMLAVLRQARNRQLPALLARIYDTTRTPAIATIAAGAIIVLAISLLVPFHGQLVLANGVTLGVFAVVDLALFCVKRREPTAQGGFSEASFVPLCAALLIALLLLAEIFA
jgi:amino acid transporter